MSLGLLAAGFSLMSARAQCDPAGGPCEPPAGEREKRPTATETRLAPSVFTPTATQFLCLDYNQWLKCIANPQCQPLPPLCPSATPLPSSTPTATPSPTATLSPTATHTPVPSATGTKFLCLDYNEWLKCIANPQCQGIPLCPWSKPVVTPATRTPQPPLSPDSTPLGPVQPLALGIAGAVAMLGFAVARARLYKDRH